MTTTPKHTRRPDDEGGLDPSTIIGIGIALVCLYIMMFMEGTAISQITLPAPMILVFGATIASGLAGMAFSDVKKVHTFFIAAIAGKQAEGRADKIETLVKLATRARKDGLLALEDEAKQIEDPFLKKGLQMCADSMDSEEIEDILYAEIATKRKDDATAASFFSTLGAYAPSIGIVGTVTSLVHVLGQLDKPDTLGPLIAAAFVATFWGVLSANFLWLPMGNKITRTSELEVAAMTMTLEGIREIQNGTSPRTVRQKLNALLPPSDVAKVKDAA